jgi:hemerythrin
LFEEYLFESGMNTHFAYEELCMALRGCKVAQKNKEAHNKFLEFWADFNRTHTPQSISVAALETLLSMLTGWLTQHICKIDVALRNAT